MNVNEALEKGVCPNGDMKMTEEWVNLDYKLSGRSTSKDYKIRKDTLDKICMWWIEDVGMLTPKQYNHIKRAMALAIFEQKVLEAMQSPEVSRHD